MKGKYVLILALLLVGGCFEGEFKGGRDIQELTVTMASEEGIRDTIFPIPSAVVDTTRNSAHRDSIQTSTHGPGLEIVGSGQDEGLILSPGPIFQMPKGRWQVVDSIGYAEVTGYHKYGKYEFYYIGSDPDSVYILKGED